LLFPAIIVFHDHNASSVFRDKTAVLPCKPVAWKKALELSRRLSSHA